MTTWRDVSTSFTFTLKSEDRHRPLPHKIIIGQNQTETIRHVALKFLAWVLFYRERLRIETDLENASIPFVPDLVEIGYDMRPLLWVECGECTLSKLSKLAVKCPEAELWIVKRSVAEAEHLAARMAKEDLRRGRYGIIGLDQTMFQEVCAQMQDRNEFLLVSLSLDPPQWQFDLNNLWFDAPFTILKH